MAGLCNTEHDWGWFSITLHWLSALLVFGLYVLGWWMVDLDYYSSWYRNAPFWHKSFGLLLLLLVLVRLGSRLFCRAPQALSSHRRWERLSALVAHALLYLLLLVVAVSGYLISSADGRGISVFGLVTVPALVQDIDNLEDVAGEIHELSTDALVILALLHALAGLKHHFVDRDATLTRMLGFRQSGHHPRSRP
jgi:cytochrome b561